MEDEALQAELVQESGRMAIGSGLKTPDIFHKDQVYRPADRERSA